MTPEYYEQGAYETVEKQERVASLLDGKVSAERIYLLVTAVKYLDRMGRKSGEGLNDDARKAADYLCRAVTGVWLDEVD